MYIICVSNRIDSINEGGTVEPQNTATSLSEVEPVKPSSLFSRVGGAVFSPSRTFKEVGLAPRVLMPIIVLLLVCAVCFFFMAKHLDLNSMMNSPQMSQASAQPGMNLDRLGLIISVAMAVIYPFVMIIMALIIAGIGKLITFLVGAENTFKALFSVTLYIMIPITIIQAVLIILLLFLKGPGQVSMQNLTSVVASNLGAILGNLFGDDFLPKFLMKLLQSVDAFVIWAIALLAIGYSAVSRKLKPGTVAIWFSALYIIMAVCSAILSSMFSPS
jgi:hypothetical protein